MIQDRAVERLRRDRQVLSRPAIRITGPAVTAWMVVGQYDAGTAKGCRIGYDLA
jgi:hypothetical protein